MNVAFAVPVCALAVLSGCGSDDPETSGGAQGLGGSAAGDAGSAASGGTSGESGGTSGQGDSGAARPWPSAEPPPEEIVCGGVTCTGSGGLTLCCTNADVCGAEYLGRAGAGCLVVNDPGRIDPSCPESAEGAGCCRSDGFCGAFYSATFGCIDPEAFPSSNIVEKIPCTLTP